MFSIEILHTTDVGIVCVVKTIPKGIHRNHLQTRIHLIHQRSQRLLEGSESFSVRRFDLGSLFKFK